VFVGRYPFFSDIFVVDLDFAAVLKVAKRVFRTGFVLVKPANLKVKRGHKRLSRQGCGKLTGRAAFDIDPNQPIW
jgi:hypothetical protein